MPERKTGKVEKQMSHEMLENSPLDVLDEDN